jgi:NitT/TauT family transport system substrate-binding protein
MGYRLDYGVPTDKCAVTVRLGIEKGFFADEGVDLSVRVVFGGPPLAAAYNRGDLQFGEIGSPPCINAMARGAQFKIVASGARRRAHMYLGVRRDIRNWQDLKGKRLGMLSIGSCPDWIARRMLSVEGLDPSDVAFIPMLEEYPRVVEVMEEGRIDACLAVEPNLSIGESKGLLNVWAAAYDDKYLPHYQWIVIVSRRDFIQREPELIKAVLRACQRSAHYAVEHLDEWVEFAARHYGIDRFTARRAAERELPQYELNCQLDLAGLQKAIEMQHELGGIAKPMQAGEIVDLSFIPERTKAA